MTADVSDLNLTESNISYGDKYHFWMRGLVIHSCSLLITSDQKSFYQP